MTYTYNNSWSHNNKFTLFIYKFTLPRDSEFIMNVYTAHVRPQLEYASCLWNTGYIGDLKLLESIQRRWTKAIFEISELSYGDRLKALNLFSFKGRLIRADLIMIWKILNNKCSIQFEDLFAISPVQFTRGHRYKNFPTHCSLDVRRRFFSVRVVNCWNSLSPNTVVAETLESFKRCLYDDLGDVLYQYH